jgi:hypothetical protein
VAERDLADEVLAGDGLLLARVDHCQLVAEGDRLEKIVGEEDRRPRLRPVLVVVRAMLAGSHAGDNVRRGTRRLSVDGADALDSHNIVGLAHRSEAAEHLRAHRLDVLRAEAADATREPDGAQQATLLPAADRVLVHAEGPSDLADLHQLWWHHGFPSMDGRQVDKRESSKTGETMQMVDFV